MLDHSMEDGPETVEVRSVKKPGKNSRGIVIRVHINTVRVKICRIRKI